MPSSAPIDFAAPLPPFGIAARIAERFRLWRERRRWIGEMQHAAALDRLDDLLNDVAMTRAELDFLIEAPADAGRQFETLAAASGVDVRALDPAALRAANWVCARCDCAVPCKRWLHTGRWSGGGDARCPNAALLHP